MAWQGVPGVTGTAMFPHLAPHPDRTKAQHELVIRRPCVRVWWWDHTDPPGPAWWDADDLHLAAPVLAVSVGYVVADVDTTDDRPGYIVLALTLCEDGFDRPRVILKSCIDRTEIL